MSRDVNSDEVWAVVGPLLPSPKPTGHPAVDRRMVVEATAWEVLYRCSVAGPAQEVRELKHDLYKNFNRWVDQGVWERVLERTQSMAQQPGELDWVALIDSTIARVPPHGATLPRTTWGRVMNC